MKCLGEIEMKSLLKVTELFIGWLLGGLYDFAALPIAVFKHMNCKDVEAVENIPSEYLSMLCNTFIVYHCDYHHCSGRKRSSPRA